MNTQALRKLRRKLWNNEAVYGLWVTLESASITEIAVASGLDWVVVDAEHGHLDWSDIVAHIRAAVRSDTVILVRIAELQEGLVKRTLDIGADGIVVPHIETAVQLERAMAYAKYPPAGSRGIGAERATGWGQCFAEHVQEANDAVLVVPLVESVEAGNQIESLIAVKGTEIFFFGPADYMASAGHAGQWEVPEVTEHMNKARNQLLAAGKYCGIVTTSISDLHRRFDEGYRMMAYGLDAGLLIRSIKQVSADLGRDHKIRLSLQSLPAAEAVWQELPPGFSTDRQEHITDLGEGVTMELADGVSCEVLVGSATNAVNLFSAIVTFRGGDTVLPRHTHPNAESITLLNGAAIVEVEDRLYHLRPLDNITIPAGYPHLIRNASSITAIFHIAMPVTEPKRELVESPVVPFRLVPDNFSGHLGPERITRIDTAYRYANGEGTAFVDFFNEVLIPGIGMSGGFAFFEPGGRLPAHLHNFDESICIVEGEATCFAEGKKYEMTNLATALQPRGKVHYFINLSPAIMTMIWVYAGPMPVRIALDDRFANQRQ